MSESTDIKSALVTGAARRIGRALAMALARAGWNVALHCHDSVAEAETLAEHIRALGRRSIVLRSDLSDEREATALVPAANEALGVLSCLVNNASVFEMDKAETVTRESWDRHMETNLRAPLVLSQAFARQLPSGAYGNIVNLLDQRVWKLTPYFLSYTVAKTGLWTLTRTLALSYAPWIRVNAIGPGPTLPSPRQTEEQFQRQWSAMPLKRGTTPEEIAEALLFILNSPAMTGQMIALDGGEHLGWQVPGKGFEAKE